MKQVKLTPNEWNGNIVQHVKIEEEYLDVLTRGAYFIITRFNGIYELEWHRGLGDTTMKAGKRLSTINKVANQYGIEFVLD